MYSTNWLFEALPLIKSHYSKEIISCIMIPGSRGMRKLRLHGCGPEQGFDFQYQIIEIHLLYHMPHNVAAYFIVLKNTAESGESRGLQD